MVQPPAPSPLSTAPPWDLVADAYVARSMDTLTGFAREALRLAAVSPDGAVADVACGPGTVSLLAARLVRHVEALDISPGMIARLESLCRQRGLSNVNPQVGDGQSLPWDAGSFEGAFSLFGLMFFSDRARGFAELRRVLAPGGRAVVSAWPPMREVESFAALVEAVDEVLPDLSVGRGPTPLGDSDSFRAEMTEAGFSDVAVSRHTYRTEFETTAAYWNQLEETMVPFVLLRKRRGEAVWAELSRVMLAALERRLGSGPQRLELLALMGVGVA